MKNYIVPYVYEVSGRLTVKAKSQEEANEIVENLMDDGLEFPTHKQVVRDDTDGRDFYLN